MDISWIYPLFSDTSGSRTLVQAVLVTFTGKEGDIKTCTNSSPDGHAADLGQIIKMWRGLMCHTAVCSEVLCNTANHVRGDEFHAILLQACEHDLEYFKEQNRRQEDMLASRAADKCMVGELAFQLIQLREETTQAASQYQVKIGAS